MAGIPAIIYFCKFGYNVFNYTSIALSQTAKGKLVVKKNYNH